MTKEYLSGVPNTLLVLVSMILVVGALWRIMDLLTPFDDTEEIMTKHNWAYTAQRLGLALGATIATTAMVNDFNPNDLGPSMIWVLVKGGWIIIAMLLSVKVVDWILLPKIPNREMLLKGDIAIGVAEFGAYVAVGCILWGSLTGGAPTRWLTALSTVVFFALGLAVVCLVFWIQEWVTPYNLRDRLKSGDTAAAIELSGVLIAAGIVVRIGVAGDFVDWVTSLKAFGLTVAIALVVLYLARWTMNLFLLRGHTVRSVQDAGHPIGALVMASAMIFIAIPVQAVIANVL
jgi:uncharacterized membrane protein YjfL (UPF0719 family)